VEVEQLRARVEALRPSFHSPFDFGAGIVTKPAHVQRRFRRRLRLMQIPKDLTGKTVLDIGAWDGFFFFAGAAGREAGARDRHLGRRRQGARLPFARPRALQEQH
jgi:hypothetical protein